MVVQNKSKSNSGIRNLVTRSNMIMLIMVTTIVLQVTAMVLSLTHNKNREEIETAFKGETKGVDDAGKVENTIVILGPIMLFIVGAVHVLNMLLLNHRGLRILSTLALLVVSCLVGAFLIRDRDDTQDTDVLSETVRNVIRADAILSLIYSILQFLSILRP